MSSQADPLRTAPDQQEEPVNSDGQASAGELPSHVDRYRVERLLGEGGFGRVYLAYDEQLQRRVAVKVPHRRLVGRPEDADAYLAEARTTAGLDHPHIVPVVDTGSTAVYGRPRLAQLGGASATLIWEVSESPVSPTALRGTLFPVGALVKLAVKTSPPCIFGVIEFAAFPPTVQATTFVSGVSTRIVASNEVPTVSPVFGDVVFTPTWEPPFA
jgi:hypothetical protein